MNDAIFSQLDFGPLKEFLDDDNVTDVSYSGGNTYLKTLDKGVYRVERPEINNALLEKLAFQCSNVMGKTFNMAHPFLDAESAELRLNFVHDSIATNGVACVMRKTPAKIRLNKEKLINEKYVTETLHDFLITCVEGHCNIIVSGETGSGKTELVKYLASHTKDNEKIITIEDTLELHLDKIFPHRDIVAMKTNNIASYSDVLVTCMRQNPKWILLSEVRSAEAVTAVRNSISSGHNIISTIHSDRAANIPMRLYSLLESNIDVQQFLNTIHRYVQIGIHVKGYMSAELGRFQREIIEVAEFYVDENNNAKSNVIFKKSLDGKYAFKNPSKNLIEYLGVQGVSINPNYFVNEDGSYVAAQEVDKGAEAPAPAPQTPQASPAPAATSTPATPTSTEAAPAPSAPAQVATPATPNVATGTTPVAAQPAPTPATPTVAPQPAAPVAQPVTPAPATVSANTVSNVTAGNVAIPSAIPSSVGSL